MTGIDGARADGALKLTGTMSSGKPPIWVVLRAHVLADPRKTGALVLLSMVMVGMYVRLLVFNDGPKPASAAATTAQGVPPSPAPEPGAKRTAPDRRIPLNRPLATSLQRDPFSLPSAFIAPPGPTTQEAVPSRVGTDVVQRVREMAGQLVLQSTFVSNEPLATINGRVLSLGDQLEGFSLERVEPTFVIVQKDGVLVKVTLK